MSEEARRRYRDYVVLSLEAQKVTFEAGERELIGDGIAKFELDGDVARGIVSVVATERGQILGREVAKSMLGIMAQLGGRKRAVTKGTFEQGVKILQGLTKGHVNEANARAWLKLIIEGSDLPVRGSGLLRRKRWFRKIKPMV